MEFYNAFTEFHFPGNFFDLRLVHVLEFLASPDEVIVRSKDFKDEGNKLYKVGKFEAGNSKYDFASKLLSFTLPSSLEAVSSFHSLACSLTLNLAACALKLGHYTRVIELCSLVLQFDVDNPKALFRRACAVRELGNLPSARLDLVKVAEWSPKDRKVLKEMHLFECLVDQSSRLDLDRVGKRVKIEPETASISSISDSLLDGSSLAPVTEVISTPCACVVASQPDNVKLDPLGMDYSLQGSEQLVPLVDVMSCSTESTSSTKPIANSRMCEFVSRNRSHSMLRLSSSTLQQLSLGKSLQFYHSGSFSFMSVRVRPVSNIILKEAILDGHSREAVVSTESSLESQELVQQVAPISNTLLVSDTQNEEVSWSVEGIRKFEDSMGRVKPHETTRVGLLSGKVEFLFSNARPSGRKCVLWSGKSHNARVTTSSVQGSSCVYRRGASLVHVGEKHHRTPSPESMVDYFCRKKVPHVDPSQLALVI